MSSNSSTRWTKEEEAELLDLARGGARPRLIAMKLQRTERAVSVRLAQLKKQRRDDKQRSHS